MFGEVYRPAHDPLQNEAALVLDVVAVTSQELLRERPQSLLEFEVVVDCVACTG